MEATSAEDDDEAGDEGEAVILLEHVLPNTSQIVFRRILQNAERELDPRGEVKTMGGFV